MRHPGLVHFHDGGASWIVTGVAAQADGGFTVCYTEVAGSRAQHDPRLRGQLEGLRSRRLSQFAVAVHKPDCPAAVTAFVTKTLSHVA